MEFCYIKKWLNIFARSQLTPTFVGFFVYSTKCTCNTLVTSSSGIICRLNYEDIFVADVDAPDRIQERIHPDVDMREIMLAMAAVMRRAERFEHHEIEREQLSTRERMADILEKLKGGHFVPFSQLFSPEEGKLGVVVSFLAILELIKERLLDLVQHEVLGVIHVKLRGSDEHASA